MKDPYLGWVDIKPQLVREPDGWRVDGVPYYAKVKDDSTRIFCPNKYYKSKYIKILPHSIYSGLTRDINYHQAKIDGSSIPSGILMNTVYGAIEFIFSNTGMYLDLNLNQNPGFNNVDFDIESTFDVNKLINLNYCLELGVVPGRIRNFNDIEDILNFSYNHGQLSFNFDLSGQTFPLKITDAIDVQVGASADDGYITRSTPGAFDATGDPIYVGKNSSGYGRDAWYRLTGITIPQGYTIDVAYISLYERSSSGSPLTKIYADDQNDPSAISSYADYDNHPLTTAGVDMDGDPGADGWYDSPSIVSIIQELVNSYDYSNEAIQILHKNDGTVSNGHYRASRGWDYSGNIYGCKLHIEYSTGVINLSLTDGLNLGDAPAQSMVASISLTEGLKGGDSPSNLMTAIATLLDGLKFSDSEIIELVGGDYFGLSSGDGDYALEANYLAATRFQNTVGNGTITKLEVLVNDTTPTGNVRMGVFEDNGASNPPTNLLLDAGAATVVNGWVVIEGLNLAVTLNSFYWLTINLQNGNTMRTKTTGTYRFVSQAYGALPDPFPGGSTLVDTNLVMRAWVQTGTGIYYLTLADGLNIGETLALLGQFTASLTDGIKFSDTEIIELVAGIIYLSLAEGLKAGDSESLSAVMNVIESDGLKIGDNLLQQLNAYLSLSDGTKMGDALSQLMSAYPSLSEGIKAGDSEILSMIANLQVTDGMKLGDAEAIILATIGRLLKIMVVTAKHRNIETTLTQYRLLRALTTLYRRIRTITTGG